MVRYLKIKVPAETQPALSHSSLNSPGLTRAQRITESLKKIPPEHHPESLEKKLHELESKLLDYQEQVRKKETALKLAQQFKQEEIEQPLNLKSDIPEKKEGRIKHVDGSSLRKYFSLANGLIIILSVLLSMITTQSFLIWTQNKFEKTFIYRPKSIKKDISSEMVNRLAAYMTSNRLLAEIIQELEKLSPNETIRQQQLKDWLIEYRRGIKVYPDAGKSVIELRIKWDRKEKSELVVRQITDAYLEIINTQKGVDDYLQYFKKAVDKSAGFKTRDKVILLNIHQRDLMKDLFVKKQPAYKALLTNLEEKAAYFRKILPLAKEEKYVSALSNPQSMDDYILVGLRSRLFDLEAAVFIAQETGAETVLVNNYSRKLQQIRGRMEQLIKVRLGRELKLNEKQEFSIMMKKMRIEIKKEILSMVMAGQYGLQRDFSINQREYLVNQRKIHQLLNNYSSYASSQKRLSEVFDQRVTDQHDSLDKTSFSLWKTMYQRRFSYAISLGIGTLLGIMLILFAHRRKPAGSSYA